MLVPLHHACSYCRDHILSPETNKHDVCQLQWRRCNLAINSKRHYTAQKDDAVLKKLSKHNKYSTRLVEDTQLFCKDDKIVILTVLQSQAVSWYHHYLQHSWHTFLEQTLHTVMYWKGMRCTIQSHVESICTCQVNKWHTHKYGKLPDKLVITKPWEALCVDLIELYTLKVKNGADVDFMCLTMIDPAQVGLK